MSIRATGYATRIAQVKRVHLQSCCSGSSWILKKFVVRDCRICDDRHKRAMYGGLILSKCPTRDYDTM